MTPTPPPKSNRRGFFRLGLEQLRDAALDSAREIARASATVAEAARDALPPAEDAEIPAYHRARRRAAGDGARRLLVRPPGALPEVQFLALCDRCRKCVDACPEHAIFRAGPRHGPALELTPALQPDQRPCALCEDVPCAAACPTGALVPLVASAIRVGVAVVLDNLCLNRRGESCDVCLPACPIPGALRAGQGGVPVVDPATCTGCGACAHHCRAYPRALRIDPV